MSMTQTFGVPNVFPPNGDGVNDEFNLPFDGFKSYNIVIINRWGNVMWDKTDQTGILLWDRTDNGGEKCTDGVYFLQTQWRNARWNDGKSAWLRDGNQIRISPFLLLIHNFDLY